MCKLSNEHSWMVPIKALHCVKYVCTMLCAYRMDTTECTPEVQGCT